MRWSQKIGQLFKPAFPKYPPADSGIFRCGISEGDLSAALRRRRKLGRCRIHPEMPPRTDRRLWAEGERLRTRSWRWIVGGKASARRRLTSQISRPVAGLSGLWIDRPPAAGRSFRYGFQRRDLDHAYNDHFGCTCLTGNQFGDLERCRRPGHSPMDADDLEPVVSYKNSIFAVIAALPPGYLRIPRSRGLSVPLACRVLESIGPVEQLFRGRAGRIGELYPRVLDPLRGSSVTNLSA